MYLDILIFALIAAFLIYRLNAVLGTRNGEERPRQNPFASDIQPKPLQVPLPVPAALQKSLQLNAEVSAFIDPAANKDGKVEEGLKEIAAADPDFDVAGFVAGAKYAFEAIVTAYSKGSHTELRPLLSPKLYADFKAGIGAREALGHVSETTIHRILALRIVEAHLGGAMAYITVDYDVEQTTVTRDKTGAVVEGHPERITSVEDIWTFTRDTRSSDPNWILIETRAAEKPDASA